MFSTVKIIACASRSVPESEQGCRGQQAFRFTVCPACPVTDGNGQTPSHAEDLQACERSDLLVQPEPAVPAFAVPLRHWLTFVSPGRSWRGTVDRGANDKAPSARTYVGLSHTIEGGMFFAPPRKVSGMGTFPVRAHAILDQTG